MRESQPVELFSPAISQGSDPLTVLVPPAAVSAPWLP